MSGVAASRARKLEAFGEEEAGQIFRIHLGESEEERHRDALAALAKCFERLPLAVVLAAELLRKELDFLDDAARSLRLERLRNQIHDVPALFDRAIDARTKTERKLLEAVALCSQEGVWLTLAAGIARLLRRWNGAGSRNWSAFSTATGGTTGGMRSSAPKSFQIVGSHGIVALRQQIEPCLKRIRGILGK